MDKCIALTFDDGPGAYTDLLLDTLNEHEAAATFYVLGSKVADNTGTLQRMSAEGHEIGNHTWDHQDLTELSSQEIQSELQRTDQAITRATGEEPGTVRPPYGALDQTVRQSVNQPMLLWDVDTRDWESLDSAQVTDAAVQEAAEGSVLLFHDIHASTVEAIPGVLQELEKDGYEFVTVEQLFDGHSMESGSAYSNARGPFTEDPAPQTGAPAPRTEEPTAQAEDTAPNLQEPRPRPEGPAPQTQTEAPVR
ncbi:polysaccharide deacetylase family protein [Nocardiopsis xinjiangensis]|uniref:polysaccharide deacetylase family protein n=1 Tax=Nocardiopsis xinjiangensis TaxID=124285 RepID=UPI001F4C8418|nr:polysaccharide deacetylase family protein [Nocardiopsis xinjiangensis]